VGRVASGGYGSPSSVGPAGDFLMPKNHTHPAAIAVLRRETGPVVLINGHRADMRPKLAALLACLVGDLGRVVSYSRLCSAIGHKSARWSNRHVLQQYIRSLKGMLGTHQAPFAIAVVPEVGYALCEIAENARGASTRWNGTADLPELGRNVRRLRTAAGLTKRRSGSASASTAPTSATWKRAYGIPRH
jgi:DNA-binding winged helix-turn-helix (wHTH) protein